MEPRLSDCLPRTLAKWKRFLRAAVSVLVSVSLFMVTAPPVFASCVPGQGRNRDNVARHVGVWPSLASVNGVQATILEYDPYYSGNNGAGTNMSVMLDNVTNYVQVGWVKENWYTGHTARYVWYEGWDGSGHFFYNYMSPKSIGTFTTYEVTMNLSTHHVDWWVNGTGVGSLGTNWSPTRWDVFGETHDREDQMPGGTGSVAVFNSVETRNGSTWTHRTPAPQWDGGGQSYYGASDSNNLFIWDKACSS